MRERYLCMVELQQQLMELFDLCGVEAEMIKVSQMPVPLVWLEKLIQDNQLYDYLENLTGLSVQAVEKLKDIKLDAWSNQESERRLDEAYQRLEEQDLQLTQNMQAAELLKNENTKLREQMFGEQKTLIKAVITLRDNLLMKKEWLESSMPEEVTAAKLINGQLQETAKMLEDMGVEIMQDGGAFDSHYHTVVQTRPAENTEQIDQIVETFRPGYRFRNEILRSQEVIVYIKV